MKDIQPQHQHRFEEFDQHISLWNTIPAGSGNSLVLLRKIVDGIESSFFSRNPCIVIAGEGARELGLAVANTLCSQDIREVEGQFLYLVRGQSDYFDNSLFDAVHIINDVGRIGMSECALWHVIKTRIYKTVRADGSAGYNYVHGIIILAADDIKAVPSSLCRASDYKVVIEEYTREQLELIIHQRLKFCGVNYQNDEEVLKTINKYGGGKLVPILDLLKICIFLAQFEHDNILTLKTVDKAFKMV